MAKHLDLEEQEQLDEFKHFWKQYGNLITWGLIAVLTVFAGWNGYRYWQHSQATQASVMFDEVVRAAQTREPEQIERSFAQMKDRFSRTTYAQQAGLLAAKVYEDSNQPDAAQQALAWVAEQTTDAGYQSVAKLRLASLLLEKKSYDEALKQVSGTIAKEFAGLAADRRGDILMAQGQTANAQAEYEKAYKLLDEQAEYRRLVEVKLNALGVDPAASVREAAKVAALEGK